MIIPPPTPKRPAIKPDNKPEKIKAKRKGKRPIPL